MRYVGIDPSTNTGLVVLSPSGEVLEELEITTKEKKDPLRFMTIANDIAFKLESNDIICIEGFSHGSKGRGVGTQYGIGWAIRSELVRMGFPYQEVSPGGLKKFASGKGNTKKDNLVIPIYKKWGYESDSDNIRDAYVLARIAEAKSKEDYIAFTDLKLTDYQKSVINNLEVS